MKAAVYHRYGAPEVVQIEDVPNPTPAENEVLVKVHATTITSGDSRMRRADPFLIRLFNGLTGPKRMTVLGSEFAGQVEAVGKEVREFQPGDQVYGSSGLKLGAHAEYLCLPEDAAITAKPTNLSDAEAASIPFGGHTALHFLRAGNIQAGQRVLVYGASGAVGTAAVQLAKHFGAEVTGVCSTANLDLVTSLGADEVIDYTKQDFTQSGTRYDIIFDTVGMSPFAGSVRSLQPKGYYLRAVHLAAGSLTRGLWTTWTTGKQVIGGVAISRKQEMQYLKDLSEAEDFKPVIDREYPFEQIGEAHRYVDTGRKKGSVVVTLEDARQH